MHVSCTHGCMPPDSSLPCGLQPVRSTVESGAVGGDVPGTAAADAQGPVVRGSVHHRCDGCTTFYRAPSTSPLAMTVAETLLRSGCFRDGASSIRGGNPTDGHIGFESTQCTRVLTGGMAHPAVHVRCGCGTGFGLSPDLHAHWLAGIIGLVALFIGIPFATKLVKGRRCIKVRILSRC